MTLTEAQRCYLRLAKASLLSAGSISPGPSQRCVDRLVDRGLLERVNVYLDTKYLVTEAGLEMLADGQGSREA